MTRVTLLFFCVVGGLLCAAGTVLVGSVADAAAPAEGQGDVEHRIPAPLVPTINAAFAARSLPPTTKEQYGTAFTDGYLMAIVAPTSQFSRSGANDDPANLGFIDGVAAGKKAAPLPLKQFIALFEARGFTRQTLTGTYTGNFEQLNFVPDGAANPWWFVSTPYAHDIEPGHLTVVALVSTRGAHGHFGSYEREMLVVEVQKKK